MLNIVCLNAGSKYSNKYVNILCDSIARNVSDKTAFKFICFTNDPVGLDIDIEMRALPEELEGRGWWNKLYLFKNGHFLDGDRIVFFDLKNVIISSLDDILAYAGKFANLRDFLRPDGQQSALMAWEANTLGHIWEEYAAGGYPDYNIGDGIFGDHVWIEKTQPQCDFWQDIFPDAFVSYKAHGCQTQIPAGARIVFFHGKPWPEDIKDGWVPQVWKIGGAARPDFISECNTLRSTIIDNIKTALVLGNPILSHQKPENAGHAVIVGGAPSIKNFIYDLKGRQGDGQQIVALNNSWDWLEKNGIPVNYHVMLDARAENENFIPKSEAIQKLYATQCHPNVTRRADCLWNALILDIVPIFDKTNNMFWIGAGTTVGVRAIFLLYVMGYRAFHIYGFDSCYEGENGHAYEQMLNAGERIIDVEICGRKFKAAGWMITQMHDFLEAAAHLTSLGCTFSIHGDGMLQHACRVGLDVSPAGQRAHEVLCRLEGIENPVGAEVGVFTGEMSRRLLQRADLTLYMVDSWRQHAPDSAYAKTGDYHAKLSEQQQEEYYQHTKKITGFAGERAHVVRSDSVRAAGDIADASLDFVFLDADHTYEGIKKDLSAWSKKVKSGRILGGHDYAHPSYPQWGVKRAVDEFCNDNGYKLELGENYTWFVKIA